MQNERDDIWNPSFYNRAIRAKIGEALSRAKAHDLSEPLPDRIRMLLDQFDEPNVQVPGTKRPQSR